MKDPGLTGVMVVGGLDQAIEVARRAIDEGEVGAPIWIAGGGTIYTQMMARTELVVRTLVDCVVDGDASFPDLDPELWTMRTSFRVDADDRHDFGFEIEWWERISAQK
tara:strand:+ start:85611 stop:85934 length:324 start_codon:yes stop_codon:yes gene_type:complete